MDETIENGDDDVIDDVNKTESDQNQTTGIGCGATFNVTNDVTKDATTLDETADTSGSAMQPMPKPSLPKPVLEAVAMSLKSVVSTKSTARATSPVEAAQVALQRKSKRKR